MARVVAPFLIPSNDILCIGVSTSIFDPWTFRDSFKNTKAGLENDGAGEAKGISLCGDIITQWAIIIS